MNENEWKKQNRDKNFILFQPPETIVKPSHIIKKIYSNGLTQNQKKLHNLLLRELFQNDKNVLNSNVIKIKRKNILEFLGVKKYNELELDLSKLTRTLITLEEEIDGKIYRTRAGLISSYTMPKDLFNNEDEQNHNITIRFDTKLTETFHKIKRYIKIDINELQALKNTHSITLYEIFKRQLNNHSTAVKINFSEDDLKKYLNIEKKYKISYEFHKFVIKKVIKEINRNTNITVNYERIKESKGKYLYKFTIGQYIELTYNNFVKIMKKNGYYKSVSFLLNNKKYCWMGIDKKTGEYALDIHQKDSEILLINENILDDKIRGKKRNYYLNRETFSGEEADEIHRQLYKIFLNDKSILFTYKLFILQDFDNSKNIKSIADIDEKYWDFVEEYSQHFTK